MRLSPRTLLAGGMIALALANLGRIPSSAIGGRSAALTLNDLMLVPLWMTLGAVWLRGVRRVRLDGIMLWAVAFVASATLSTVGAIERYALGGLAAIGVVAFLVRWVLFAGWYLVPVTFDAPDDAPRTWRIVDAALVGIALFGILQSALLPGFAQMIHSGGGEPAWDVQGRRLVSTLLDPNFAGVLITIALLDRFARIAEGERVRRDLLLALGVALVLTLSRSAILALLVGSLLIVAVRGLSARLLRVGIAATVLLLPAVTLLTEFAAGYNKLRIDASALYRLFPWTRAIRLLMAHPVLGVGFNAIGPAQRAYGWPDIAGTEVSLDGGLLFLAAMTGLCGLALYLGLLRRVWRTARQVWRAPAASPSSRAFATGTAAMTAAVLVHSLFANTLFLPYVMEVLWLRWGVLTVIARPFPLPVRRRARRASRVTAERPAPAAS